MENNKLLALIFSFAMLATLGTVYFKDNNTKIDDSKIEEVARTHYGNIEDLKDRIQLFKEWADKFSKNYGAEEAPRRFLDWNNNYEFVQDHNAKNLSWTVEMNKFADLSTAEFSSLYLGYNPALLNKTEFEEHIEILDEEGLDLEDAVDWRAKGAVTTIKDQGQCGACYAFSTCVSLEGLYQITKKKLTSFSPQQIADCSSSYGNQGCNGGLMTNGFKYTHDKGIESLTSYPYQGSTGSCKYSSAKAVFKNGNYRSVGASYKQLQAAVKNQPTSVAIEADQQGFQMYKGGILSSNCGTNLDHGVAAVGYSSGSYWIVKNSWGSSWGEKGYIRIKMGTENSGAGVCGINSQASYPTK